MTPVISNAKGTCVAGVPFIVSRALVASSHRTAASAGTFPYRCRAQILIKRATLYMYMVCKTFGIKFVIRGGILIHG